MAGMVGLGRLAHSKWIVAENGAMAMLNTCDEKALSKKGYKTIESPWAVDGLERVMEADGLDVTERYFLKKGSAEAMKILPVLGDTADFTALIHQRFPDMLGSSALVGVFNNKYLRAVEKFFPLEDARWALVRNPIQAICPFPYAVWWNGMWGRVAVVSALFPPDTLTDCVGNILPAPYRLLKSLKEG